VISIGELRQIFNLPKTLSILILGLCEFVRGALLFFILPIYVRGVLGLSASVVGYALAAHYTMDTGLRGPTGWLTDRFGSKKVLLVALSVGWIGIWTIVRAHDAFHVIVGCAALGLGISAVWPAVISRVTTGLSPRSYATAMGGIVTAWLMGAGAGAISMSWLLGDHVGNGFIVLLVVWFISIILSLFAMQGYRVAGHHRQRLHIANILRELRDVRLLIPGMFLQNLAMGLLLPVFVLYARYVLHLDGKMYSYLLVAGGAATVLLQVPVGRLVDRYGYRPFLGAGLTVCSVLLPTLVHVSALWKLFLCVAGLGMGYALVLPAWNSVLASSVSEERRAVMWGIFMTVEGLGMAIGPVVGGRLWEGVGPTVPFWAAAGILFATMIFYGLVRIHPFRET
jgi:DHA1 family multidrug resistance protein-like MFS transporter